jgi:ABC-type transport system involved in cytochrome c biogenesis ATPase subunit
LPVDGKEIRVKIPLRQYWNLLVHYLGPQWPSVVLLAVLLFGTISLQLLNPQIARQFIDAAQGGAPPETLGRAALLFLGVAMLQQTASVSAAYLGENVGWRATNELRANLTFFDRTIPDDTIVKVIRDLGLGEWFYALPEGLDTELVSGGGGLSAGEAQLLAFTRIFLQDPGLIILDEASSRLDPVTEQLIERAVDRLVQGRTAIVIAHRLATVQRADQIMILERGQIREYGPRAALAGDPDSHYYGLLERDPGSGGAAGTPWIEPIFQACILALHLGLGAFSPLAVREHKPDAGLDLWRAAPGRRFDHARLFRFADGRGAARHWLVVPQRAGLWRRPGTLGHHLCQSNRARPCSLCNRHAAAQKHVRTHPQPTRRVCGAYLTK